MNDRPANKDFSTECMHKSETKKHAAIVPDATIAKDSSAIVNATFNDSTSTPAYQLPPLDHNQMEVLIQGMTHMMVLAIKNKSSVEEIKELNNLIVHLEPLVKRWFENEGLTL